MVAQVAGTPDRRGKGSFGGRGRGRGGGRGGFKGRDRMSDGSCFKCNESGHLARDCPQGGENKCFNCNETGHISRDCPTKGESTCYKCNETGHISRDCPNKGESTCFNCNETGHISRDCPSKGESTCFRCNETGHMARDCPNSEDVRTCFNCKQTGHISAACPSGQNDSFRKGNKRGPKREFSSPNRDHFQQSKKAKMDTPTPKKQKKVAEQKPEKKPEKNNWNRPNLEENQKLAVETQEKLHQDFAENGNRKLLIKNLPKDCTDAQLKAMCLGVKKIHRSEGQAILEFKTEEGAEEVLSKVDGQLMSNNKLVVEKYGETKFFSSKSKGKSTLKDEQYDPVKLRVFSIKGSTTSDDLQKMFPDATEIWTRRQFLVATVFFDDPEKARKACKSYDHGATIASFSSLNYAKNGDMTTPDDEYKINNLQTVGVERKILRESALDKLSREKKKANGKSNVDDEEDDDESEESEIEEKVVKGAKAKAAVGKGAKKMEVEDDDDDDDDDDEDDDDDDDDDDEDDDEDDE